MKRILINKAAFRQHGSHLLQTFQTWPWRDTLNTLLLRFREDRLGLTAGSLTFTTVISLVPLVTVVLWVFSASPLFSTFEDALQRYFLQTLVPPNIARPVLTALTQFAGKAARLGTVGLIFLALAALALMLTIDRTLNAIWRVATPRPIAQRVLVYWAAGTLGPLVLGASLSLTSYAISASRGLVSVMPGNVKLLLGTMEFGLLAATLAGLFHYVPNAHVRWPHAITGGLCAAAGFEIAKKLLGWYLTLVPTYSVMYGAFATVPILLIWIYLGWVIVLLGAVIAAYAPSLQSRVKRWPDGPGSSFQLAVAVLTELAKAKALTARGLTASELSDTLRIDPLQTEPILGALVSFDWVGRLDEPSDPRFVLLCDLSRTRAQPLLTKFLLDPLTSSHGLWRRAGFDTVTVQELLDP